MHTGHIGQAPNSLPKPDDRTLGAQISFLRSQAERAHTLGIALQENVGVLRGSCPVGGTDTKSPSEAPSGMLGELKGAIESLTDALNYLDREIHRLGGGLS